MLLYIFYPTIEKCYKNVMCLLPPPPVRYTGTEPVPLFDIAAAINMKIHT